MKHILAIIPSLTLGGAEKAFVVWVASLQSLGYRVSVATTQAGLDFFSLPAGTARFRRLGEEDKIRGGRIGALVSRLGEPWLNARFFKSVIDEIKPDVVIAHLPKSTVPALMVTVGTGIPCFVMEHLYQKKLRDPLLNLFRRWLYPQATGLVVLTPAMRALFAPLNARIVQIANPIAPPSFVPSFEEKEKVILLSGRLVAQKQFSSFVEHLSPDFLGDWRVEMAGEGAERGRIEEAIRQRGLSEKVILLGAQADMGRLYARASLFVLCSKQEGFSLVLAEAALYGCVRVSFLCPTGPEILIKDGETGYLIQDQNWGELLDRLRLLMQDDALRRKIYTASLVPLAEFDPQEVARQWQVLIEGDFHGYQDPTGNP